jgi:hypothetical protein
MQLRFFAVPVRGGEGAAEELNAFLAAHRILAVDPPGDANSVWALRVSFEPAGGGALRRATPPPT